MPYKNIDKRRACRRRWYNKNKKSEKLHVLRRKSEIRKWFENYKKDLYCMRCKESHPAIIDFHHTGEKDNSVSFMVANGYSIEKIREEIKKCVVLCSNCHRKEHYNNSKL